MAKFLLVSGAFYTDLADALAEGAQLALKATGHESEEIRVPGALEIPAVIAQAAAHYDGFVALGTVIRGETGHYDIVAGESSRALMDLTVQHKLAIGNGILTVENRDQAWERADVTRKNKGAGAAQAAMALYAIKQRFGS